MNILVHNGCTQSPCKVRQLWKVNLVMFIFAFVFAKKKKRKIFGWSVFFPAGMSTGEVGQYVRPLTIHVTGNKYPWILTEVSGVDSQFEWTCVFLRCPLVDPLCSRHYFTCLSLSMWWQSLRAGPNFSPMYFMIISLRKSIKALPSISCGKQSILYNIYYII